MQKIFKDSKILLIFFLVFLFKENVYGILIKISNLENIQKSVEQIEKEYYKDEYFKLLNTINLISDESYKYQYSKTLYRDVYDFYNEITILKGKKDNISLNSAVINEYGLIGTVKKVNKNSSIVSLITNKKSQISVKVNESFGMLEYKNNSLIISSINNYQNINVGDIVYTSGLGGLPKDIKIGTIEIILKDKLEIEKKLIVKPFVDFNNINYVAILSGEEA